MKLPFKIEVNENLDPGTVMLVGPNQEIIEQLLVEASSRGMDLETAYRYIARRLLETKRIAIMKNVEVES